MTASRRKVFKTRLLKGICAGLSRSGLLKLSFDPEYLKKKATRIARLKLFETPFIPPIIVTGLPRSGTTMLHRLLSLAGDARSLALWEVLLAFPGHGPEERFPDTI